MPVTLFDGSSKPIEQIVVGDRVLAYDESNRSVRVCEVLQCHRHAPATYREVFLQDGRRLEVTGNHELFVGDGWLPAVKLRAGSVLFSADRERIEAGLVSTAVERVEDPASAAPLFDITVAECHNYFVNGVLAHNKNI
jgi:intein/homing endonuclease